MRTLLFLLMSLPLFAQTPSDCTPNSQLLNEYEWDIANLAIRRMREYQSPDLLYVNIPQYQKDTIIAGLSAILNSSFPESDSIFNRYCVHDRTSTDMTWQSLILYVDTSYAWTAAWQNLTAITGNPIVDSLVVKYGLTVSSFNNYSWGSMAVLDFTQILNINALIDSLEMEPAITLAEANAIIGLAGKITYELSDTIRYYNFRFEFSDCFDGCDNYREWRFAVNPDCSVEYLGFNDFGFFGIQPLPAPTDCNLFSAINRLPQFSDKIYPNPATSQLTLESDANTYTIFDLYGRTVKSGRILNSTQTIDINDLNSGIYLIQTAIGTEKFVKK